MEIDLAHQESVHFAEQAAESLPRVKRGNGDVAVDLHVDLDDGLLVVGGELLQRREVDARNGDDLVTLKY